MTAQRWEPGDEVVLRYITRQERPGMSWPARIVEDRDDLLALFIPEGATTKQWRGVRDSMGQPVSRELVDIPWRRDTLRLMYPGADFSIWLSWRRDGSEEGAEGKRVFHGYYINMEEPYRRTEIGVDTNDHTLDVVVRPDLSWEWKDDDQLTERAANGIYVPAFADHLRQRARLVLERLDARDNPFDGSWLDWTPDGRWAVPSLPDGWNDLPATLWPDRHSAYGDTPPPLA